MLKDNEAFQKQAGICYKPNLTKELYTYSDFLKLSRYNNELAELIFDICVWQHPETILDRLVEEGKVILLDEDFVLKEDYQNDAEIKCTNCWNQFTSEFELELFEEEEKDEDGDAEYTYVCPECETDAHLVKRVEEIRYKYKPFRNY